MYACWCWRMIRFRKETPPGTEKSSMQTLWHHGRSLFVEEILFYVTEMLRTESAFLLQRVQSSARACHSIRFCLDARESAWFAKDDRRESKKQLFLLLCH